MVSHIPYKIHTAVYISFHRRLLVIANSILKQLMINTPLQNTEIVHDCKNDNFQMEHYDSFLIFAQNIDCGYTLEPLH